MFFLRLDYFTFSFGEGLNAYVGVRTFDSNEITFSELLAVPRFLRFDFVKLNYSISIGQQSIAEKFESFRCHLPSIKATLYDSNIIWFKTDDDPDQAINCPTLLELIRNIVSICDSSRGYAFDLANAMDASDLASILEMPAIASSSSVHISPHYSTTTLSQVPIEIISNWLNRERQAMNQKQRKRVLELNFSVQYSQIQEMCDFLKQVSFPSIHILNTYTFIICGLKLILFLQH